jgi:hypothetical protein
MHGYYVAGSGEEALDSQSVKLLMFLSRLCIYVCRLCVYLFVVFVSICLSRLCICVYMNVVFVLYTLVVLCKYIWFILCTLCMCCMHSARDYVYFVCMCVCACMYIVCILFLYAFIVRIMNAFVYVFVCLTIFRCCFTWVFSHSIFCWAGLFSPRTPYFSRCLLHAVRCALCCALCVVLGRCALFCALRSVPRCCTSSSGVLWSVWCF